MRAAYLAAFAACLPALAAPPESVAFVRGGRVWFQAAGSDRPTPVVADDPGWSYVHPTWLDAGRLLVIRNKSGEWGRSHVGVVQVGQAPVPPGEVTWLPRLAGAYIVGLAPDGGISYLKLAETGVDEVTVYLGRADSDGTRASSWPAYTAMYGVGTEIRSGLRASSDGLVSVPSFPTDVSNTIALYRWARRNFVQAKFLDYEWLAGRNLAAEWVSAAFGGERWLALGSMRSGLWLADRESGELRAVDTWEAGQDGIKRIDSISFAWNQDCYYYEVSTAWSTRGTTSEVRRAEPGGGRPTVVLHNASMPDVMPPFS